MMNKKRFKKLLEDFALFVYSLGGDSNTLPDVFETNGMRIQNGQIVYSDPNSKDSDGDGIPDNEELNVNLNIFNIDNTNSLTSAVIKAKSNALFIDSDGDGYLDSIDPNPHVFTYVPDFGTWDYENKILEAARIVVQVTTDNKISKEQLAKLEARKCLALKMREVNNCGRLTSFVSSQDWLSFCRFFNEQVKAYGKVDEELHYFRNKLNRCPENLQTMIDTINNAEDIDDKWIMCCPNKGRYHMFGETGAYNIKFISSNNTDNLYEAVYDKDGNLITENDNNGQNMGTYNYASSSKDAGNHKKFDVKTYEDWGNTLLDPKPQNRSWDNNVAVGWRNSYYEPRKKGIFISVVDKEARDYYTGVCGQIGIVYYELLLNDFSDKCYKK